MLSRGLRAFDVGHHYAGSFLSNDFVEKCTWQLTPTGAVCRLTTRATGPPIHGSFFLLHSCAASRPRERLSLCPPLSPRSPPLSRPPRPSPAFSSSAKLPTRATTDLSKSSLLTLVRGFECSGRED